MTDGVLLAETRQDKSLKNYDVIIIDEAHERSLNIDFLLGYLHKLLKKRTNLKIIIASATIDTAKFSRHFDNAPIISVSGRTFPIETRYIEPDDDESYVSTAIRESVTLYEEQLMGDILIFMPTERDIRDTVAGLDKLLGDYCHILPLFGRLQASDQRKIFKLSKKRKIIVATNVQKRLSRNNRPVIGKTPGGYGRF